MSLSVDINDQVTPLLKQVEGAVRTDRMNAEVGRSVVNRVQAHFFKLDQERPNALGGKRTHFYSSAAKSTQFTASADQAVVSINELGIRQRLEGGPIAPVRGKYLTIPAIAEAYGKRAREFSNLHLIYRRGEPIALVEGQATTVKHGKKGYKATGAVGGKVFFWLRKSVMQKADRGVLPSDEAISSTASQAATNFLMRLLKGGAS